MSYALPADLLARFDARVVGNLVSDSGGSVNPTSLLTDPNLQAALDSASGAIEAALLQGERYATTDLAALTGNSKAYLVQICCEIAFAKIYERRPYTDAKPRVDALERAEANLELLRSGKNVFNVQAALGSGVAQITGASTPARRELNLIVDRACAFYPPLVQPNDR